jgi:hypothetical protein
MIFGPKTDEPSAIIAIPLCPNLPPLHESPSSATMTDKYRISLSSSAADCRAALAFKE